MKALMGEFIGRPFVVTEAPGVGNLPMNCQIVDETLNMLYVRPTNGKRVIGIQKRHLRGMLKTEEGETALIGDEIRVRPEDRIKRYAMKKRGTK
jgi:RNase P/RNase MRP subunit p29